MCKKLLALAAVAFVGVCAQAKEVVDMEVDWTSRSWNGYVMGYIPQTSAEEGLIFEWPNFNYVKVEDDGVNPNGYEIVSINGEQNYVVPTEDGGPMESWGIQAHLLPQNLATEIGTAYSVTLIAKSNKEGSTLGLPLSWGWGSGEGVSGSVTFEGTGEWEELTCDYAEVGGASCWMVGQMYSGDNDARICIKSLKITHNESDEVVETVWEDWLVNGDAEGEYGEIPCAYAKEYQGRGADGSETASPEPAEIIEMDGSKVFVVRAKTVDTSEFPDIFQNEDGTDKGDPQWQNQFWIQSPKAWSANDQVRISFRYKADKPAKADTQAHAQNPGSYLHWSFLGEISFTTEWQEYSKVITLETAHNGAWSAAFNLKEYTMDNNYYFDDLKWETMKLDEGWFVAGDFNDWNYGKAIEMEWNDEDGEYQAVVGTDENPASQICISTKRGNDTAFKANCIKTSADLTDGEYVDFTTGFQKINLPEGGVWKICIDPEYNQIGVESTEVSALIDGMADDNATPVYYNLQGMRVNNPVNGNVYIVKRGNKVAKQIIR